MNPIQFKPVKKVADTMPPEERKRTAALLNVRTQEGEEEAVKLLLDVVFQSVPVKRPLLRGHWFAACRSALITVQFRSGTILDRTAETSATFQYKVESSSDTEFGAEFKPTAKVGPEGATTEISVVSLTAKKKDKSGGHIDFTGKENTLSVTGFANSVTWDYSIIRGKRAISDFLSCNLPLWVDCKPRLKQLQGTVELLPSIFNFDRDKEQMSGMKSFLMQLTLAFRKSFQDDPDKAAVLNQEGILLTFGESK
jgi:hypothetical protein